MSALVSLLKRSSVHSALLRTLQPARSLHASACVRAAPMDRAAMLRKASDSSSSDRKPLSSRAPPAESVTGDDAAAAAAANPAAATGAAAANGATGTPRKPRKPEVETWPESRVEQICNDVLREGRAALAELQAKGLTPPAAHEPPLAKFDFPRLNSFERHIVHKIADQLGPKELSHASQQIGTQKYITLAYVVPTPEPTQQ